MPAKLRIELAEGLGLIPPVLGYLANATQYANEYTYYGVRHPGGIFNIQLAAVTSSLLDLTTHVATNPAPQPPEADNGDLLRKLVAALFSFANYYNAAYDIILGCCKKEDSKPDVDVWKWLKEHGYRAESVYRSNLSEARFFVNMFNELKHSSKRFGTVTLTRPTDGAQVSGYYLEAINESGAIVPDPEYHPPSENAQTANSFNRDLRLLYYLIYKVSDSLRIALESHFVETYSTALSFDHSSRHDDKTMIALFDAIRRLPLEFFPNESRKRVPVPRIVKRGEKKYLFFEDFRVPDLKKTSAVYEVGVILPAPDGFSRSWGLPYMRKGR